MNTSIPHIEISLDNLVHNLAAIRSRLPREVNVLAVVKDNAYGCGSRVIAKTLEDNGVTMFAVCRPQEAFFLRKKGVTGTILVLGPATKSEIRQGHRAGLTFALNDIADIATWKTVGVQVRFHCNIDTRMHRMGILPSDVETLAGIVGSSGDLVFDGVFTHLASADVPGTATVAEQLGLFTNALMLLKERGLTPRHVHYANSAGIMRFDLPGCTLARPGIALYGCKPDPAQDFPLGLLPVAALKSRVVKLKKVPADTPVSYGGRYVTDRETTIATIALGYGHGYPRSLTNRGELLVRGRRYRIAGTVTMDYCMIDAGPDPCLRLGDEAVAMGSQGNEHISPDDIALLDSTIAYEILCSLSASIDRVYVREGKIVDKEKGKNY
jgi:alanine racemase